MIKNSQNMIPLMNTQLVDKAARHVGTNAADRMGRLWSKIVIENADGAIINADGTVHYDDYKDLTADVVAARRFNNVGIQDLIDAGLTTSSSISKTLVQYQDKNTFTAGVSMNGSNREENQSNYGINWIPQPIYTADFVIPWREEGFSYKESDGVEESVYVVNELQDTVLFNGADLGVQVSGAAAPLYGYTNHPATIAASISDWSLPATIDAITPEAVGLIGQMFTGGKVMDPDSVVMYVATDVWSNLQNDYSSQKGDRTVLERLLAISEVKAVKPQKDLVAGAVCCVELRARTIQLSVAQMPIAVPHVKNDELEDGKFTIYSCMVAKIKKDRTGQTGIVYATKS